MRNGSEEKGDGIPRPDAFSKEAHERNLHACALARAFRPTPGVFETWQTSGPDGLTVHQRRPSVGQSLQQARRSR